MFHLFLVSRILSFVLNRLDLVVPFLQVSNVRVFLSAENNANDCAQKIVTSYHYHLCSAVRVILLVDMSFLKKSVILDPNLDPQLYSPARLRCMSSMPTSHLNIQLILPANP